MRKTLWLLFLAFLLLVPAVFAETLDYNQCKIYYQLNQTCLQQNCSSPFYQVEVCAKEFPRINKNIILDSNNPIYILPDYNFSVKVSEETFQTILQNTQDVGNLKQQFNQLRQDLDTLNNRMNQISGEVQAKIDNATASLNMQIIELQNAVRSKSSSPSWEWILAAVALILIVFAYFGIKAGIIETPKYKAPEFQTTEPRVEELRKKRYKKP